MGAEHTPIDRIEHELDIEEAALAADAGDVVADADVRAAEAKDAAAGAVTDQARLAATLEEHAAHTDVIKARSAASRADWELGQMGRSDHPR